MKDRRIWLKGEDKVYVSNRTVLVNRGSEFYAWLDTETGDIEVAGRNPEEIVKKSVFHEFGHKSFLGIDPEVAIGIFGTADRDELEEREEKCCRHLEDRLFPILNRANVLRFPKPPRFK